MQKCAILLLTPLLDLWFDCHGFSIASYLRQEASQRAQKLTNEVSSTCMRGGKSLKLNMAPIIRHQEVIQEKKKHPRNISRCCVSFRVCILHASHFKLHIDNSPWPSRRISNTMSLAMEKVKRQLMNHWASLSTLTTWSTGIFKVSWIFKNSKRIIMNHQQSLFSQKTYPNMIRWDKMI